MTSWSLPANFWALSKFRDLVDPRVTKRFLNLEVVAENNANL
jgi:hypothetical protein